MEEIWKPIEGYGNSYEASNYGNVKSLNYNKTGKEQILKQFENTGGYMQVFLGKGNEPLVSVLIYETFIGPIPKGMQVNHIDENKRNNAVWNLNLMTAKENANWGTRNDRMLKARNKTSERWAEKVVEQYTKDGQLVKEYKSVAEVVRVNNFSQGNISNCCNGKLKSAYGYVWKYKEVA